MTLPLVPAPAHVSTKNGSFAVTDGVAVIAESSELAATTALFIDDVRADTGIALADLAPQNGDAPAITVAISRDGLESLSPAAGIRADGKQTTDAGDERHRITISSGGIRISGATLEAVHRGLTTVRQLIAAASADGSAVLEAGVIVDGPRFAWRGLSFDVVRTFHGPETVRRVIDMCSVHKLNVLHLHLTDDQGWRIAIPSRPELTTIGGAGAMGDRSGGYYSLAEMAELVEYAAARFVTLVPEIDMPGHTGAIFRAYPELAPAHAQDVADGFAIGTLEPEKPETWTFVEDVLDAVIAQFPQSAYLHVGGDEAFGMADEAHAAFVERAVDLVRARGRLAVGWQEITRAAIGADEIVQYWMDSRESEAMIENEALRAMIPADLMPLVIETIGKAEGDLPKALGAGARLLISPTSRLYFDRPHEESAADPAQDEMRGRVGLPVYPAMSLRHGVEWDPVEDTPGVDSEAQVAGVEGAIWCETIATRDELEFMLLPRLGGLAEKAWGPSGVTAWEDYSRRLGAQATLWAARGWTWFRADAVDWAVAPAPR